MQSGLIQTEEGIVSKTEKGEWNHIRRNSNPLARGQSDLIGGIDTENHFQTTSQRQMNGVKTSQDQLTLVKRAGHRKVLQDPAQATPEMRYGNLSDYHSTATSHGSGQRELLGGANGYSYQPQAMGGSLIKNLGSSLASRVEPPKSQISHQSVDKTLITENFNSFPGFVLFLSIAHSYLLGYTGRRRIV